jgi:hypothetical protein
LKGIYSICGNEQVKVLDPSHEIFSPIREEQKRSAFKKVPLDKLFSSTGDCPLTGMSLCGDEECTSDADSNKVQLGQDRVLSINIG